MQFNLSTYIFLVCEVLYRKETRDLEGVENRIIELVLNDSEQNLYLCFS
jgi:hypothetical protein